MKLLLLLLALQAKPSSTYRLPWEEGKSFKCTQGFNGALSHNGNSKYAIDFSLPEGTKVCAARGGKVTEVKEDESKGGMGDEFKGKGRENKIRIDHGDGTTGLYLHLKKDGALVDVGDTVMQGDIIGLSGGTGYASGPHLHFQVNKGSGWETIAIAFDDIETDAGVPIEEKSYTSKNTPGIPAAQKDELLALMRQAKSAAQVECWGLALPRYKKVAEAKLKAKWDVLDQARAAAEAIEKKGAERADDVEKLQTDKFDDAVMLFTLQRRSYRDTPSAKRFDSLYGTLQKRDEWYAALAKTKEIAKAQESCYAALKADFEGKPPLKTYQEAAKSDSIYGKFAAARAKELETEKKP